MLGMVMSLDAQSKLKAILEQDEGYRQFPYKDTKGFLTCGIGRNLQTVGLSHDEASYLLQNDIRKAENELITTWPYYKTLDDARQVVILSMAFNMGVDGLMQFRNMLGYVQANNWQQASKEMLNSEWAKEVGNRAQRLAYIMERGSI